MIRSEGIELSIEFLHWASKQHDKLPRQSQGTTLVAAKEALDLDGQALESSWPYDDTRDQRSVAYAPPMSAVTEAQLRKLNCGRVVIPRATAVHDALGLGSPVVLGIWLHTTWFNLGADGRIAMPPIGSRDLGGHAVTVVGFRPDEFIIQNSWGIGWGIEGFAYLPSDYVNQFGISSWIMEL